MATTRSTNAVFSAGPPPSRRSRPPRRPPLSLPPPAAPRRWGPGISCPSSRCCTWRCRQWRRRVGSQCQPCLSGPVGDRGHPAVVAVATAVEDDRLDAGVLGPLADELADLACLGRLVAVVAAQVGLHRRRGGESAPLDVVDDLHEDVPARASDDQARARRRTADLLADSQMPPGTGDVLVATADLDRDAGLAHHLPAFPALRRMCSPWYRTPLPL